jgi:outer membrane protein assembly factor BamB
MNLRLPFLLALTLAVPAFAQDWPQWGRDHTKNMVAPGAKYLPSSWNAGERDENGMTDMKTTRNIKWVAKLGSQSYGNPTVAGGKVFVGTNNEPGRDARYKGDHSLLMCFDEKTGDFLWQFTAPKIGSGKVGDWEYLGIASSPTIDGDRLYIVTNRFEILCLDVNGQKDGNQGYQDEGKYQAGLNTPKPPMEVTKTDADIIWRFDMSEELGTFPHNITSSSILVVGDLIFCSTSNGVDYSHQNIPNPKAPSLVCLNKKTGKLAGEEIAGMGHRIMHGGWTSPCLGNVNGRDLVFFGGPDGIMYAFESTPEKDKDDPEFMVLKEVWRCDGNLPHYRFDKAGKPIKYVRPDGPSEFIATPVFYKNRIYAAIGQDPEHGEGQGRLLCIDATKTGDISKTGVIWDYGATQLVDDPKSPKINRALSTVSIDGGLVYVGDYAGWVHCVDAETGRLQWKHDSLSHIWGSTLVADGKVFIGNEDGLVNVFNIEAMKKLSADHGGGISTKMIRKSIEVEGKRKSITLIEVADKDGKKTQLTKEQTDACMTEVEMPSSVLSSPIYANGVLYIATASHLYAIEEKEKK